MRSHNILLGLKISECKRRRCFEKENVKWTELSNEIGELFKSTVSPAE
jgi:hypothetical protein